MMHSTVFLIERESSNAAIDPSHENPTSPACLAFCTGFDCERIRRVTTLFDRLRGRGVRALYPAISTCIAGRPSIQLAPGHSIMSLNFEANHAH